MALDGKLLEGKELLAQIENKFPSLDSQQKIPMQ